MPGQLVRDAKSHKLIDDATLTTTTTGTAVDVQFPGMVRIEAAVGAFTGTTPTLDIEIQSSNDSTFATGVVSHGRFARITDANDERSHWLNAYCNNRYMRAVATVGGTTPSVDVTVEVHPPHQDRTPSN